MHGQSPKQALRPVQGLICISTNIAQGRKETLLSRARVFLLPRHVSMSKKSLPISGQGFQWPLCTPRIELPQTRDVEIKARLAQRRVLKGHLVYPLPPRGLEERPPAATMGFNWALLLPLPREGTALALTFGMCSLSQALLPSIHDTFNETVQRSSTETGLRMPEREFEASSYQEQVWRARWHAAAIFVKCSRAGRRLFPNSPCDPKTVLT